MNKKHIALLLMVCLMFAFTGCEKQPEEKSYIRELIDSQEPLTEEDTLENKTKYKQNSNLFHEADKWISEQLDVVREIEKSGFDKKGLKVNKRGKNKGLKDEDFNQFNEQLATLNEISPEIEIAIKKSVKKNKNYSRATKVAYNTLYDLKKENFRVYENGTIQPNITMLSEKQKNQKPLFEDDEEYTSDDYNEYE